MEKSYRGFLAPPGSPDRREADRQLILHPERWPLPVLPLKRYMPGSTVRRILTGYVLERHQLFSPVIRTSLDGTMPTRFDYEDIDAMLADGWTVD
jgi:hypothetical protein